LALLSGTRMIEPEHLLPGIVGMTKSSTPQPMRVGMP
jgi:hypothetical protein